MADKQQIQFVDNRIVAVKLVPPYEVPDVPFAAYQTYDVEYAIKLFSVNHGTRPKVVYQDFTANMVYIPLEGEND